MNIRGNIVVTPHILKFIIWYENLGMDDDGQPLRPLNLSDSGIVGHSLKLILSYKMVADYPHQTNLSSRYSNVLPYLYAKRDWERGKTHVSKDDIIIFNSHMHKLFHETLFREVVRGVRNGRKEKEAIHDFLILIRAEEDIWWETVKKGQTRLRNSKKIGKINDKKGGVHNMLIAS